VIFTYNRVGRSRIEVKWVHPKYDLFNKCAPELHLSLLGVALTPRSRHHIGIRANKAQTDFVRLWIVEKAKAFDF